MMEWIGEYIRGMGVLLSDIALICLVLGLMPLGFDWDLYVALPYWTGFLALQFLVNHLAMVAGMSVNLYLVFNSVALAVGTCLTVRNSYCYPCNIEMMIVLGTCVVFTGIHSAYAAYHLPDSNRILEKVDRLIGVFVFYLFMEFLAGSQTRMDFVGLTLIALVLNLLAVNQLRTGGEQGNVICGAGTGGKLMILMIIAGCLCVTAGIVGKASGQVHSAVDMFIMFLGYVWSILSVLFRILGAILGRIFLLIAMLLPSMPPQARASLQMTMKEEIMEVAEETGFDVPLWVFQLLLAIAVVVLVGYILYQLRGKRIQRVRRNVRKRNVIRKSRFFAALRERLLRLRDQLELEWNYRRYRKTPEGLLILAERVGQRNRLKRQLNESPGEYIRRFAAELDDQTRKGGISESNDADKIHLPELACQLDQIYYGGRKCELNPAVYDRYARQIQALQPADLSDISLAGKFQNQPKIKKKTVDTRE